MALVDLIEGSGDEAAIEDTGENAEADNFSDESLARPAWQPRGRPLTAPVLLARSPSVSFGHDDEVVVPARNDRPKFGDNDEVVMAAPKAPKPRAFGQDDEVVVPAQKRRKTSGADDAVVVNKPTNPLRVNGMPEQLVPLAPRSE